MDRGKGKNISTSTPSFSIRYNAEDEEIEQLYDAIEPHSENTSPQSTPTAEKKNKDLAKSAKRSGSFEEAGTPEPWKLLTEFKELKGHIFKTVEEKIEEMNRLKQLKKKKKKLQNNPSLSDSEEKSESQFESSSPEKSLSEKRPELADSDLGDISETECSFLESDKATTPLAGDFQFPYERETPSPSHSRYKIQKQMKVRQRRRKRSMGKIEVAVDSLQETYPDTPTEIIQEKPKNKKIGTGFIVSMFIVSAAITYYYRIPHFIIGLILGALSCLLIVLWTDFFYKWISGDNPEYDYLHGRYNYENIALLTESMVKIDHDTEEITYEAWMNEFRSEYEPEIYHVSQTESVFVSLKGSLLKMSTPKNKIPKKAFWNEPEHKLVEIEQRIYDISNCNVLLLPEGLIQKRLWSKKYPICIELLPQSLISMTQTEVQKKEDSDSIKEKNGEPEDDQEQEDDKTENIETQADDEEENSIEEIPMSATNKFKLYLFTRTDREKDLWFRRFKDAVNTSNDQNTNEKHNIIDFISKIGWTKVTYRTTGGMITLDYSKKPESDKFIWLNLFLARLLYDPMSDPYWIGLIKDKIQRKLSVIKVPNFMETFVLSNIEFTDAIPTIENSQCPKVIESGIWFELDIAYQGTCKMIIDTKLNLVKMKNLASRDPEYLASLGNTEKSSKSAYFDSSQEDSAETSCEEEEYEEQRKRKPSKALTFIDKVAASKMFQQMSDYKLVRRAMEKVSDKTTLSLSVELKSLVGTIVLNIPPPPSDRVWYGFKPSTKLHLSAKPRLLEHGINMSYITAIIEKKLYKEFQKVLVIPNMDDIPIPFMSKKKPE